MNTVINKVNNEMFLELFNLFETKVKSSKFPNKNIHNKSSKLENEFLFASYQYHEDGAVHCDIKIWTEDNTLLFKSSTAEIKITEMTVLKSNIKSIKEAINQFFYEFVQKYKK